MVGCCPDLLSSSLLPSGLRPEEFHGVNAKVAHGRPSPRAHAKLRLADKWFTMHPNTSEHDPKMNDEL